MKQSGLKFEPKHYKDFSHEKVFGSPTPEPIIPLGRLEKIKALNLPVLFQGEQNTCVACSVTFLKQYLEATGEQLSWEFLAQEANTSQDGATIKQVLEPARKVGICSEQVWKSHVGESEEASKHRLGGYLFVQETRENIYAALKQNPIIVGLYNWGLVQGGHCMVIVDVNENGDWVCANWWNQNQQDYVVVDKSFPVEVAVNVTNKIPDGVHAQSGVFSMIKSWLGFGSSSSQLHQARRLKSDYIFCLLLLASILFGGMQLLSLSRQTQPLKTATFGASGVLSMYKDTIASPGIASTDTTIPVSSGSLFTGETFASSDLIFPVYLILNPGGSTQEITECHAYSALSFTGCIRGLSAKGSNTTSTVSGAAYSHAAGETVLMSNPAYYYSAHYVDLQTAQSVTGTKTFVSDQIQIGNSASSTLKYIFFPDGQTNSPYFKIVGPTAGNTTSSFFFSTDGLTDLQLNASGTVVGASSTHAITIVSGLIAINASTTQGLNFDVGGPLGGGYLVVTASSTASANGGFIQFATSTGGLYFDTLNFLAGGLNRLWTWTGANMWTASSTWINSSTFAGVTTFSGGATSTGSFQETQTPVASLDVVNKGFLDLNGTYTTGTVGVTVTSGQALFISSSSTKIGLASASATGTAYYFVGISTSAASTNATVTYAKPGAVVSLSGLTSGKFYYLSNTDGSLSTIPGTISVRVGIALTNTTLLILPPAFRAVVAGTLTGWSVSSVSASLGFIPTRVDVLCQGTAQDWSRGVWSSNGAGGSTQYSSGVDDSGAPYAINSNASACKWKETATTYTGTITTTTSGFTMTTNNTGSSRTINYIATYDSDSDLSY